MSQKTHFITKKILEDIIFLTLYLGVYTHIADFNLDGAVNFKDFIAFADTWLWQTSWR
ncbi:MAG: hypothetical protein ACYTFW_06850 [Planctomycetota bacterium]